LSFALFIETKDRIAVPHVLQVSGDSQVGQRYEIDPASVGIADEYVVVPVQRKPGRDFDASA
jgi:hypothetical protein